MVVFNKLCMIFAGILGIALMVLGVPGLFAGCSANFTLPPIFGVAPALVGWGIFRAVRIAWHVPVDPDDESQPFNR